MAGRYGPVGQVDHLNHDHDDTQVENIPPSPFHADSASPLSNTTSATMASPSSSTYVTLADQTFTPLSMGSSDYYLSDHDDGNNNSEINEWAAAARGKSASGVEHNNNLKVLRPKRALLRRFEGGIGRSWIAENNSTNSKSVGIGAVSGTDSGLAQAQGKSQALSAPPVGNGATIVSAMIQSFEALQPAGAPAGYDLISTKNTHHRKNPSFGLVSPPSTVSPSPPPSLSCSPVAHDAPQRLSRVLNTSSTGRDIVVTAHYAVRPSPEAHAKNPDPAGQDNKQENPDLQPSAQRPSAPRDTHTTQKQHPSSSSNPSDANAKTHTLPALSIPPYTSSVTDFAVSSVSAGGNTIARPTAERPPSHTPRTASPSPTNPLFRTSSTASLTLSHPTPDIGKRSRSGAYLGNIAALEATAERLSTTSSIDIAIREELDELKRSDSRRSSILQTNSERRVSGSDCASLLGQPQSSVASRQNSILGTNNVARFGGYSPGGFIMSPHSSVSGAPLRLRSASKASSYNVPSPIAGNMAIDNWGGEDSLFMSRHGPGKSSVRSTVSRASLGLIAELDQPSALTKEAFDAADRVAIIGEDAEDDDTIRASAHQHIEAEFADVLEDVGSPQTEVLLPVLDNGFMENGFMDSTSPRLQLHQPEEYPQYRENLAVQDDDRPTTSGSNMTYEAQRAFGDFDGVHCDPEVGEFPPPQVPRFQEPEAPRASRQLDQPPPRPKSYFDHSTGQQMLFYPAPVPAMLNLPPKLSRKSKAETSARNIRRSQILSAMPQAMPQATSQPVRASRVWLPDPMEGVNGSRDNLPFMTGLLGDDLGAATPETDPAPQLPDAGATGHHHGESSHVRQASETSTIHAPPPAPPQHQQHQGLQVPQQREIRRPQKITEANKRNTRATMLDDLPPQLRASAFFDLPSTVPKIEVKGGSAMATLDSILDASASAPVSAFTDHVFAGKLGAEVYGAEKKKKKKSKKALAVEGQEEDNRKTIIARDSSTDLLDEPRKPNKLRKRASQLSLLGLNPEQDRDMDEGARRTSNTNRNGSSPDSERGPISPNELAPDSDEDSEDSDEETDESSDEDEDVYQGAPTTLLAELQLRKQQNKMRTKPKYNAHSNGLHTTLLELDAVAEVERKARKGKRINLAWEDPNANPDHLEDMDDDEVPLGMLFAAKATGNTPSTMDISAVMNEVNRPLGLMERRELEDNEPLSQRRDRLQGRNGGLMPMSLEMMQKRMTQLSLAPFGGGPTGLAGTLAGNRSASRLGLPYSPSVMGGSAAGSVINEPVGDEGEVEGETLAQRKARLAAENPLPRARPVSGIFSSELLGHFGGEEDVKDDSKNKGKEGGVDNVPEEEETLGQRRKRLQAEREAREREMNSGGGGGLGSNLNLALPLNTNRNTMISVAAPVEGPGYHLPHQMSMSNMLAAHPFDSAQGRFDPRNADRLRKDADAERIQMMEKDAKMAALRAQMPTTLERVSVGAQNGGYMGGKFNNGSGGNPLQPRVSTAMGNPINAGAGVPMNINPAAAYAGMPMPLPGGGISGGMQQGQPVDMVERWRQSVMP